MKRLHLLHTGATLLTIGFTVLGAGQAYGVRFEGTITCRVDWVSTMGPNDTPPLGTICGGIYSYESPSVDGTFTPWVDQSDPGNGDLKVRLGLLWTGVKTELWWPYPTLVVSDMGSEVSLNWTLAAGNNSAGVYGNYWGDSFYYKMAGGSVTYSQHAVPEQMTTAVGLALAGLALGLVALPLRRSA